MKKWKSTILLLIIIGIVGACKKSNNNSGTASLNIVNAIVDIPSLYTYFRFTDSAFYLQQYPIGYASAIGYKVASGDNPLSLVSSADTTKPILQTTLHLNPGKIYSLYLAGASAKIDTLLIEDNIPVYADSSAGVRFINLSPDSGPVTINLEGSDPSQPAFNAIQYKQISPFKTYSASTSAGGYYNFELHDQTTGDLLTGFSWSYLLSKNNTLVITGLKSDGTLSVFSVNNY